MFGKKKKNMIPPVDWNKFSADWSKDFEFLNFVMQRKKAITKNFLIDVVGSQKEKDTYLTDDEIEPIIEKNVIETDNLVRGEYRDFLIHKYFGNEDNYLAFIAEDYYVDLTAYAINKNSDKIKKIVTAKLTNAVSNLNKKQKEQ